MHMNQRSPFSPTQLSERKQLLARDLSDALDHHKLQLVYQPTLTFKERRLVSAEALSRWHHPELGPIPADEFIAIAESKGMISRLGNQVLEQVLKDLPAFLHQWPHARIAVNVSGLELSEPDFADRKIKAIESVSSQFMKHIEWEVTETFAISDTVLARQHLELLRQRGMSTAMDDFGTGQSSLTRLHQLPFDKIKLDRAFVLGLQNPDCRAEIKAMSALAQDAHMKLVVEGIETEEDLTQLALLGCDMGQGYLFSKPVALQDLLNLSC